MITTKQKEHIALFLSVCTGSTLNFCVMDEAWAWIEPCWSQYVSSFTSLDFGWRCSFPQAHVAWLAGRAVRMGSVCTQAVLELGQSSLLKIGKRKERSLASGLAPPGASPQWDREPVPVEDLNSVLLLPPSDQASWLKPKSAELFKTQ